jgi:hypothetical protein
MENNVYDDEKIVDDLTAQKLATAYSAMMTALDRSPRTTISAQDTLSSTQILTEILLEVRAIRKELQYHKRIRLEF